MSFADWLGKIQEKPYAQRVKIMWVCVGVSMVFVFLFWLFSLSHIVKEGSNQEVVVTDSFKEAKENYQQVKKEVPGLWQTLKASIFSSSYQEDKTQTEDDSVPTSIFKEDEDRSQANQKPLKLPEN